MTTSPLTRRHLLSNAGLGFGWLAFSALATEKQRNTFVDPLAPKPGHHPARAKRVIFVFLNGGPSHLDTFDWKPALAKMSAPYLPPQFEFKPRGRSGLMISEAFPELARHADDLCLINSATTNNPGHQQAVVALHTGNEMFVRPSMGAWVTYGLGSAARDLPGFITLNPIGDLGGAMNYGSAFLPASYQGTRVGSGGGVPDLRNRQWSREEQARQLRFMQGLNRRFMEQTEPGHPELEGVIQSHELAFQMQRSVPEVFAIDDEPRHVLDLYGIGRGHTDSFGRSCLLARRLAEKGVRFIQVTSSGWDHHNRIREALGDRAAAIDLPLAGLIADLKQRDLLKDTLIVCGGEFGRGSRMDNGGGRGHQASGFTVWMAGGGVKGGHTHGATDDLGERAVDKPMPTPDLHATLLHLLGLDHELLTFRHAGRDFRLTDVAGAVHAGLMS
jgi:hypothetical protein